MSADDDLLARMSDLLKQAVTEKSHFYTAAVLRDAMTEIARLREIESVYESARSAAEDRRWC